MPYEEAVRIFGSEDELKKVARRPSRLSNWKHRGVPAGIVLPVLLERFRSIEERKHETPHGSLVKFLQFPGAMGRLSKLPRSFRQRYQERLDEIAAWVHREVDESLKILEVEYETGRRKRKERTK